jgi:hypothetical protein
MKKVSHKKEEGFLVPWLLQGWSLAAGRDPALGRHRPRMSSWMPEDLDAEELVSSDRRWWIQSHGGRIEGEDGSNHSCWWSRSLGAWYVALFFPVFTTSSRSECEFYHAEKFTEFDILNCNSILFCACYKHKLEKQSKNQLHKNCLITKEIDYNSRG